VTLAPSPPAADSGPAHDPRPLLAQHNFASLWWGQLISLLGDRLTYLALFGLLLEHTGRFADTTQSSVLLGVLGNVMLMPVLLFAPFVGPWVDRWNLRTTLVVSDLVRCLLVAFIPISYALTNHVGTVFGIVFLMFTCNVFFLPAKSAMTPEIVPPAQLLAANTLLSVAGIVATAVGALVGGWVVDHWGWRTALWIDAATYLVSVVSLALIRYRPRPHGVAPERSLGAYVREVGEGLDLVRRSAPVGLALTALSAVWVGGGFVHVAGNQHIQRAASVPGAERIGILMAVVGLGAGLGTWWVNSWGKRVPRPVLLGVGLILASVWLVAFAVSTRFAVFAISGFLVGLCIAPTFVLTETLLQEGTDLHQRGRVFSLRDFAMRLGFQVAIWVAALLTPLAGTSVTMIAAAGVVALAGALSLAWGRRAPELMGAPPAH
jgi:predicted MFS family arabinose efflux permease